MAEIQNTSPVLPVADLQRSLKFYTETLKWSVEWSTAQMGSVIRDKGRLMLSQMLPVNGGSTAWVGLSDDTLIETYRKAEVTIVQEPQNWDWGYEMKIADPDGNILWLACEPRDDLPKQV